MLEEFLKENLTFDGNDSPAANLLLSIFGAVAEFERSLIKERQMEGIRVAQEKGKIGRPKIKDDIKFCIKEDLKKNIPKVRKDRDPFSTSYTIFKIIF